MKYKMFSLKLIGFFLVVSSINVVADEDGNTVTITRDEWNQAVDGMTNSLEKAQAEYGDVPIDGIKYTPGSGEGNWTVEPGNVGDIDSGGGSE